ncbi:MAG: metal-dependent transcriptional regulator [Candidatus Helarchaeota archaeon]|nr:metal-dependent transcriptional regulator [Candidatus Helarchaeota archaeon]
MSELRSDLEEILEIIWMLTVDENEPTTTFEELYKNLYETKEFSGELTKSLLEELISLKLIDIKDDIHVALSQKGYDRARQIIRAHRLYERLFADVLRIKDDAQIERGACVLEHIIAEDVEETVCTLLGHPTKCPHGRPIPPGLCCERRDSSIASIFTPVTELDIGETGQIAYISSNDNREMDKLLAFGILPGNAVKLHQKMPYNGPIVIQIDQTQVALEKSVADQICVRRIKK